jgi:hypothetical protein
MLRLILCSAMNERCEDMFQEGVSRPAALGCRERNHEGTGCTCVSILDALSKFGSGEARGWDKEAISARATSRKWRTLRSILSRCAFALIRVIQAGSGDDAIM